MQVDKNAIQVEVSSVAEKRCGRCGAAVDGGVFCSACQKFFRALSERRVTFPTEARGERKDWSGVGKRRGYVAET